jgi:hypothetical protein
MAPQKKIKTHKDSLKRPCFQCCVTKLYCNKAYLFEDKVFATPLVAYYYFNTIAKLKPEEKDALLLRLIHDTNLRIKGDFDDELCIEELLICNDRDEETSIKASYDQECLISAEDFEKLQENTMEEDTFEEEKPPKVKSYIYLLEEDTVTELVQNVGQPLDQFLPPELWYMGEKTLVHKNRDISVTVYISEFPDGGASYKNELFSKYFGDTQTLYGKVYVHSFSRLPMMESANAALDKEMEKMEVEQEVKERKKKARVPRKKVVEAMSKIADTEPGSVEEKEAVRELQEVAQPKKKRSPKRKISAEVISKDLESESADSSPLATKPSSSASPAKRVKKSEEEKAAEKQAKEEAKAAKLAEKEAAKKAKEEEKAKKAAEREAKKKEKEDKKAKKQEE